MGIINVSTGNASETGRGGGGRVRVFFFFFFWCFGVQGGEVKQEAKSPSDVSFGVFGRYKRRSTG